MGDMRNEIPLRRLNDTRAREHSSNIPTDATYEKGRLHRRGFYSVRHAKNVSRGNSGGCNLQAAVAEPRAREAETIQPKRPWLRFGGSFVSPNDPPTFTKPTVFLSFRWSQSSRVQEKLRFSARGTRPCTRAYRLRCQPNRKRESQHHVSGCETWRSFSDVLPFGRLWYAEPDAVERRCFSI